MRVKRARAARRRTTTHPSAPRLFWAAGFIIVFHHLQTKQIQSVLIFDAIPEEPISGCSPFVFLLPAIRVSCDQWRACQVTHLTQNVPLLKIY